MSYSRPPVLKDQELDKLLREILEKAFGGKVDKITFELIVGIAKEMIKEQFPEGIPAKEARMENSPAQKKLSQTLLAATSVALLMTHSKDELHNMLDRHKALTLELKGLKPTPENAAKRNELIKEINELKNGMRNTLKLLNRFDNNKDRQRAFDRVLDSHELFDKLEQLKDITDAIGKDNLKNNNLTPEEAKALGDALTNLYGQDPRIAGSVASPVQVFIGNEYGIPDNSPAYSSGQLLHVSSEDYYTSGMDSQKKSILDTMEDSQASYGQEVRDSIGAPEPSILDAVEDTLSSMIDDVKEALGPSNEGKDLSSFESSMDDSTSHAIKENDAMFSTAPRLVR